MGSPIDLLEGFTADDTRVLREARDRMQAQRTEALRPLNFSAIFPPPGAYRCRGAGGACGAVLDLPGICLECGKKLDRAARAKDIGPARASIPELYRWATWKAPELGTRVGVQNMLLAHRQLAKPSNAAIVGKGGSGKTSIACAALRGYLDAAPDSQTLFPLAVGSRFIAAWNLGPDAKLGDVEGGALLRQAIEAPILVLDDLGSELGGASPGTGLCSQRSAPISRVLLERHSAHRITMVTTWMRADEIASIYGPVYRRIMDPGIAKVVDLDKPAGGKDRR